VEPQILVVKLWSAVGRKSSSAPDLTSSYVTEWTSATSHYLNSSSSQMLVNHTESLPTEHTKSPRNRQWVQWHTMCMSRAAKPDFQNPLWYDNRMKSNIFNQSSKNTCSVTSLLSSNVHITRRVWKKAGCEVKCKLSWKTFQHPDLCVTYTVM
jgi:hypothetical protein